MHTHRFDSLGTRFSLTVWDALPVRDLSELMRTCEAFVHDFDHTYSRFRSDSLVTHLSTQTGVSTVPHELVVMLRHYETLYHATDGKVNPCIGFALEDTGYDPLYSLTARKTIRSVPPLEKAVTILDDTHIELHMPVLFDLGALGKGYVVDLLTERLQRTGVLRFLVDGSGDVRYHAAKGGHITCGLEDPSDTTRALGTFTLAGGALCASALTRRMWGNRNHYLDPATGASPTAIQATWVHADTATYADGIASALFFTPPEILRARLPAFEYLLIDSENRIHQSPNFDDELFFETNPLRPT